MSVATGTKLPTSKGKGEETRAAILDAAIARSTLVGLAGLSIGALAREVGLSKSGLFAHFQSKEDLQTQILETARQRFIDQVLAPAIREPRGEPRIRALFEGWFAWSRSPLLPGGCPFVNAAHELETRPGPPRDRLLTVQRELFTTLATAARLAVEEGHFRPQVDVEQFAHDLIAIYLAFHHFSRLLEEPRAEAWARRSFEDLLGRCRA